MRSCRSRTMLTRMETTVGPRTVTGAPLADLLGQTGTWLDTRLGLSALRYRVPAHANTFWYTLGGMTFVGMLVLVVTGVWLGQYYNPDPAAARESVLYIQDIVPLGDIARGIHVWAAYLVVITALIHLLRVFASASYKIPREVNWLVGVGLLGLLLFGEVFTGTVLRWDQEAYEAMSHNMVAANLVAGFGAFLSHAFTTSVAMLPRLYIAHVSILPLVLALLLVAHFFLVKVHGISPTVAQADAGRALSGKLPKELLTGSYTTHTRLMVGYGLTLLGIAGVLALLAPQVIGVAADPSMEVTKPAFLFYWVYPFEDWFGVKGILYGAIGLFAFLVLVPFVDRGPARALRARLPITLVATLVLLAVIGLSVRTALEPTARHLGM